MRNFKKGIVYQHVYFIFIDSSGHSKIVKNNPDDKYTKGFDTVKKNKRKTK